MLAMLERAGRRALSYQDRNHHSRTYGCFDRRYWGWKIVDFPEATYQRNVLLLAGLWGLKESFFYHDLRLVRAVVAGIEYAAKVQHKDGSFDQAFVHEHSYGATGFLIHSLAAAGRRLGRNLPEEAVHILRGVVRKGADFLARHGEEHGLISNHLAGAALSLLDSAALVEEPAYLRAADDLLAKILAGQSPEGWFPEYQGADPGYQTLCVHYLAQARELLNREDLSKALDMSVDFLSCFVHPDGGFGGEYGSRRTSIYYPGGLARLAGKNPQASALAELMAEAIANKSTTTLDDIDLGNLAPLAESYLLAQESVGDRCMPGELPWQASGLERRFPEAGLYVAATPTLYSVLGVSNGGVLKVFDKARKKLIFDDAGYVGRLKGGDMITSQVTDLARRAEVSDGSAELEVEFQYWPQPLPGPFRFVILRLLNLTIMRSIYLGNLVKKLMVKILITGGKQAGLKLIRLVNFGVDAVEVRDELRLTGKGTTVLESLSAGQGFVGIHMASAGYFQGTEPPAQEPLLEPDIEELNRTGRTKLRIRIEAKDA
ncbi:hypothetical protein X474_14525 [Dethiosulfatarculus sandiegensis]|uniref:Broad-specificity ulvan lyase N-terminal domain-containing protein n=2 Tax=Dethiosulfatarculus sandiegensis TaxID=1429043 RepID=A0A0D2JCB0_9BACT|nr:hypothetical protein X474_14525 [Dethiosulfatarculus sandiegensis]